MENLVFGYHQIPPSSWAYLSSLLMLALFFKFNRVWALRNVDLILVILLAPGLLMIYEGRQLSRRAQESELANQPSSSVVEDTTRGPQVGEAADQEPEDGKSAEPTPPSKTEKDITEPIPTSKLTQAQRIERNGYIWLFSVGLVLLLRTLLDPLLIRRPQLEPNLSTGGLVFLGLSMLSVSIANIIITAPSAEGLSGAESGVKMVQRIAAEEKDQKDLRVHGPGYALFHALVVSTVQGELEVVAKVLAIAGQIALVLGLLYIGHYHFLNFRNGLGVTVLYMMLPYSTMFAGHVMHLLPAALLVWAIALYRFPLWAGVLLGLATGVSYYPFFLLPLWMSFYWDRGVWRFCTGTVLALLVAVGGLAFTSTDVPAFFDQLRQMFGFWVPRVAGLTGIWSLGWDPWFRLPIMVAFFVLCVSFIFWPLRKSVGALIAYTAAIMVSVQFWHGYEGGSHMAWYLPLCLLVFFRPNLSERFATTEVSASSTRRRFRTDTGENMISAA
jgi:hypothetical protein